MRYIIIKNNNLSNRKGRIDARHSELDNIGGEPQDPAETALEDQREQEVVVVVVAALQRLSGRRLSSRFAAIATRTSHYASRRLRRSAETPASSATLTPHRQVISVIIYTNFRYADCGRPKLSLIRRVIFSRIELETIANIGRSRHEISRHTHTLTDFSIDGELRFRSALSFRSSFARSTTFGSTNARVVFDDSVDRAINVPFAR